jgi:UDP-arabinose 4-epimerase
LHNRALAGTALEPQRAGNSVKTILVTGGAGFVGSHACKALARAGYLPVTFDNLEHGHERAVKWGPLERSDLRNAHDLRRVFEAHRPWAVMHFAAYAYVGESTLDPAKYYDNNVGGTATLVQACAAFGCRNVVFSSSCATYGVPERLPLTEDAAQNPVNPYGYTKLVVERMLKEAEPAYGIRHVALRYFNAAGADPDGELGELHLPETHLIPLVLFAAMGRAPSIKVFGQDYPTPDGTCIRDYVHVSDLADAHVAAVDWLAAGKPSDSFNLGNGRGFSVSEVVKTSEKVTGLPVKTEICARRPGDPPVRLQQGPRVVELDSEVPGVGSPDHACVDLVPPQDAQHVNEAVEDTDVIGSSRCPGWPPAAMKVSWAGRRRFTAAAGSRG